MTAVTLAIFVQFEFFPKIIYKKKLFGCNYLALNLTQKFHLAFFEKSLFKSSRL